MAKYVVASDNIDGNEQSYIKTCISKLEAKGHSCENLGVGPSKLQNYGLKSSASGKIGVFIVGGSDIGTYVDIVNGLKKGYYHYKFVWFCFASNTATTDKWITCNGLSNTPLVRAHDDNFSSGSSISSYIGKPAKTYFNANKQYINYVCGKKGCNFDEIATSLANGGSPGSSDNSNEDEEEEDWGDKDNFTPHKGKIMEIRPYKEIASVSFDKSYDSPTGTGEVKLLYNARDYRFLYKGVSMKLKLRRTSDKDWSATGLEEPNYNENEKFFKEHIPTDELLKELGLPNYRKERNNFASTESESDDSESSESNSNNSNENSNNN